MSDNSESMNGKWAPDDGSRAPSAAAISGLAVSIRGLPGRATGGPVSPGQAYLVGERGPEVFVPGSAGAIAANGALGGNGRNLSVAISINAPAGADAGQSLQRSSRQIASAVRRALSQA